MHIRQDKQMTQASFPGIFEAPESAPVTTPARSKIAIKFKAMADRLTPKIQDKRRPMTQNPTPKRTREYNTRLHDGANMARLQDALYALADLHESGNISPLLIDLKIKADIQRLVHTRAESSGYYDYRDTGKYYLDTPEAKALQALIEGDPKEREEEIRAMKIQQKEAEIRLSVGQIPGFFPTPRHIAVRLVNLAGIEPGMTILEPSAGSGAIADVIRDLYPDSPLAICERHYSLRELLELKGYELIREHDFLEHFVTQNGVDGWWRIIMNPPFKHLQDIDHVRHAYDCIKCGGRLVSIMSESVFCRETKKAVAFRAWLDEVGAYIENLDSGAFHESGTEVKTRIVTINK